MTPPHRILDSNIIATFAKAREKIVNGEVSAYNITESIHFPIYDEMLHLKKESEVLIVLPQALSTTNAKSQYKADDAASHLKL